MQVSLDAIHIVGYVGALGSLIFGGNQLRVIIQHHSAKDVGVLDYGIRVAYSVLLGIYAVGTSDPVFVVVNFGAALLSLAVAVSAFVMKKDNREDGGSQPRGLNRRQRGRAGAAGGVAGEEPIRLRWDARRSSSRRTGRSGTATGRPH